MKAIAASLREMPMLARWATVGALLAAVAGGIVGLVIGLVVYAPTAPFAVVELGLPAALAGAVIGLVAGMTATAASRIRHYAVRPAVPGGGQRPKS